MSEQPYNPPPKEIQRPVWTPPRPGRRGSNPPPPPEPENVQYANSNGPLSGMAAAMKRNPGGVGAFVSSPEFDLEGSWLGPDKVAHALFCPAITWGGALALPAYWWAFWIGSLLVGLLWELSNHWIVLKGTPGISIKDGIAFGVGWIAAGLLLLATRGGG